MVNSAFYSVIPAGGSGTRLWPLSRVAHPKFLHALTGSSATLLQATVARLAPLSAPETTMVVTGVAHATAVARQLPELPEDNIVVEPSPRDSCAAIGLAAALIARRDPDAVMGSFAADHLIRDEATFVRAIRSAADGARSGLLMTVGITPTHAETGYGYLRCGDPAEIPGGSAVQAVDEFKEKPSREVAEAYFSSGRYLWNASMFVWQVRVFLAELARQQSELFAGLTEIAQAWGTSAADRVLGEVWPALPKISVDHAVMEGAAASGLVATVPGDFGWTDVGDFQALGQVLAGADPNANVVVTETAGVPMVLRDTERTVVVSQTNRMVATVGVRDLVVVDTPDALLVCSRDRAQDVKAVVDELRGRGEDRYL